MLDRLVLISEIRVKVLRPEEGAADDGQTIIHATGTLDGPKLNRLLTLYWEL